MGTSENMWVRESLREGRSRTDDEEQVGFLGEEGDGRDRGLSTTVMRTGGRGWLVSPVRASYYEAQIDGKEWA